MNSLKIKHAHLVAITLMACTSLSFAQQGTLTINQDEKITKLLDVKKDINKNTTERYKIQIYNGNRNGAYNAETDFKNTFEDIKTIVVYEEPNFKTWVGNFRTKIEADRALKKIKSKFSNALIFKPKKSN